MLNESNLHNVSVVIPMFNNESTIGIALDSVKAQTAFNMIAEIIIINDGSTDNTLGTVKSYIKSNPHMPIRLINKANGGASSARNAGMRIAKANYIALLDADDEWLPNKIEIQMKTLTSHPEIDFLGGDYNGISLKIMFKKIDSLYKASIRDLCLKNFPATPSAIFKKKIVEEIGFFDETQKYAEEGNYFLRICSNYNFYHLPVQMVLCGAGKPQFGHSGLSANLKGMYQGNIKNIKELKSASLISSSFYYFLRVFYFVKYLRRISITKFRPLLVKLNKL